MLLLEYLEIKNKLIDYTKFPREEINNIHKLFEFIESSGIIMYKKEAIVKIGGWCEEFIGWGGEDDFQSHKTKMLLNWYEQQGVTCYHLWHERGAPDPVPYQRNLQLLNKLVQLPLNDLISFNRNSTNKIGHKNKYDK